MSGFSELSYVSDEAADEADDVVEALLGKTKEG